MNFTADDLTALGDLLPGTARELIAVAGVEAAAKLINLWGGQAWDVPMGKTPAGKKRLADLSAVIGSEPAAHIVARWGGRKLNVPNLEKAVERAHHQWMREEYDRLTKDGASTRRAVWDIIETLRHKGYKITTRAVEQAVARPDNQAVQGVLF